MYRSISFNDPDFKNKLIQEYRENGVAVINDVFTNNECETYMDHILEYFEKLGGGFIKGNVKTWLPFNLPPQTRPGLFQALVSNMPDVWTIRSHNNVDLIFKTLYSNLRDRDINEFLVSGDGINVKPGEKGPFYDKKTRDWAHLDQTDRNDIFKCIQGQAVLTNTTASFVCSPKSHLAYIKILDYLKVDKDDKSNWRKLKQEEYAGVKQLVEAEGGAWQIPIYAKKGSFIIWASSVVHSAKAQNGPEIPLPTDRYNGWRGVVYVCYRPLDEVSAKTISLRVSAVINNRVTNHWSENIFPKRPGHTWNDKQHDIIESMLDEPKKVYNIVGPLVLDDKQRQLAGMN